MPSTIGIDLSSIESKVQAEVEDIGSIESIALYLSRCSMNEADKNSSSAILEKIERG